MTFIAKTVHGSDEAAKVAEAIAEECKMIADADRCELAFKIANCTIEATKKMGLDPKEII